MRREKRTDGRTNRRDEANSRFSQIFRKSLKIPQPFSFQRPTFHISVLYCTYNWRTPHF